MSITVLAAYETLDSLRQFEQGLLDGDLEIKKGLLPHYIEFCS